MNLLLEQQLKWSQYFTPLKGDRGLEEQVQLAPEVCFFGGSFHPWHKGHQECIARTQKWYEEHRLLASVVIVPDINPWKENHTLSSKEREILFQNIAQKSEHDLIYPGFLLKNEKNPTHSWVKQFQDKNPSKKISFIMGGDNFEYFHKWSEFKKLSLIFTRIFVLSRNSALEDFKAQKINLQIINPELEIIHLGNHPYESLSSTAERNKV